MLDRECPKARLPQLIQDEFASNDFTEILEHLEECSSCQDTLESLSADTPWWERASRGLAGALRDGDGTVVCDVLSTCSVEALLESDRSTKATSAQADTEMLDPPRHPEMLGRIDEFDIEEKIGQGGMGVVFRGFDRSLNRSVAIKVMAPHLSANGVARQRFAREAQAAAAVVHPHVVPIYRVNASVDRPYIAMALVDGRSLQEQVSKNGPMETKDVVRVSIQIAAGLSAAHRQGLIHRDIKPANILMEKDVSRVMISDFGLARAVDDVAMTQSGCLAGTPHYMSPEQVTGDDLDHRSDLFSVGSVMYFLATGLEPFRAENAFAVISKIMCDLPSPPRHLNSEVPETLSRIIGRLLEKNTSDRIQSADELQHLLTHYLAHLQDPQHHVQPQVKATRSERLRIAKRVAWVFAFAGFIGLLCYVSVLLPGERMTGDGNDAHEMRATYADGDEHQGAREGVHDDSHR